MVSLKEFNNLKKMITANEEDMIVALTVLNNRKDWKDMNNLVPYCFLYNATKQKTYIWQSHCDDGYKKFVYPYLNSGFLNSKRIFKEILSRNLNKEAFEIYIQEIRLDMISMMAEFDYQTVKEIQIKIDYYDKS